MKKKLLIYCTQLTPSGGIEYHVLEFCKNMSMHYDIDLLVANFKMPANEKLIKEYCQKTLLIRSHNLLKRHIQLVHALLQLRKTRYDVLYTNGIGASVLLTSKILSYKKWVLHHHMEAEPAFFLTLNKQYKKAMLLADNVIACSKVNAQHLSSLLNRHIDVVYCFSRDLSPKRNKRIKNVRLQFGYYGRLIASKGIDMMCKLSEESACAGIGFHIWGSGIEYPADFFKPYKNLTYHGAFTTKEELMNISEMLDAFLLLTTHAEGLPISLLEVMSAGIPWLSGNKGGIPDIVFDPMANRLTDISIYETVKQAVLSLANDINDNKVLTDKQVDIYKTTFAGDVLINNWKAVFDN